MTMENVNLKETEMMTWCEVMLILLEVLPDLTMRLVFLMKLQHIPSNLIAGKGTLLLPVCV